MKALFYVFFGFCIGAFAKQEAFNLIAAIIKNVRNLFY